MLLAVFAMGGAADWPRRRYWSVGRRNIFAGYRHRGVHSLEHPAAVARPAAQTSLSLIIPCRRKSIAGM